MSGGFRRSVHPHDSSTLPPPDAHALAYSHKLCALLEQRMAAANGSLAFSEYMTAALYEPGLGYYMAGAAKFGGEGDFITAPEVSPLFGQSMAVQIAEILEHTQGGVLELGAGSGKLALGLVQALQSMPGFTYSILEPSAELVQRQRQYLASQLSVQSMETIRWLDRLPEEHTGVIVANEVMDALPVERFRMGESLLQQYVSTGFSSFFQHADKALCDAVEVIQLDLDLPLSAGYESEVCMVLKPWVHTLADCLHTGVVVLADYGYPRHEYYSPERINGTLACYFRHRAHDDPFHLPGLQDITAHVDFTAVAEAALTTGFELLGYTSQSAFLLDNELLALAEKQMDCAKNEAERLSLSRSVKVLTLPGEMGERFQIMALGKGYDHVLRGFNSLDLSHRL